MAERYFGCTVPWLRCDRDNHAGCHRRVTEAIAELRRRWEREEAGHATRSGGRPEVRR